MDVLSVADVLAMPVVRAAGPRTVAGSSGLDRPVRWVHTSELADIGPLLREGDLLLSTGIALPGDDDGLAAVVDSVADAGAAGLVVELGRRWEVLPPALVGACERRGLPLVALTREVRFAAVSQAVGERIVDRQVEELREAQRVHDTFTELSLGEAGPSEVLEAVQRLAGSAVVLEGEQHQVVDVRSGPDDTAELLEQWSRRAREVHLDGRTTWDEEGGWLVTRVGRRERGWGRLAIRVAGRPTARQVALVERGAAALALHRLHDRQRDGLVRRTHHELLVGLLADPTAPGLLQRCEAAGLPTQRRRLVGVALRAGGVDPTVAASAPGRLDEVLSALVHAAHELDVPALVCQLDGDVRALLSLPASSGDRPVDALAERVGRRHRVVVAAGRPVTRASEADRTLREARQVLDSVRTTALAPGTVHRLDDVGLRGLVALLADDERLHSFVQRQLAVLREHDEREQRGLEAALLALLTHPGSKSHAAASLHVSRPVFYDRLARLERLLGVDLDDPDVRVSLHVALVADEVVRATRRG